MIPVFPLYVLLFQQLFVSSIDYPRNWVHSPYDYLSIYIYPYNWFYDIPISYIKIYHILSIYYHIYICIIHILSIYDPYYHPMPHPELSVQLFSSRHPPDLHSLRSLRQRGSWRLLIASEARGEPWQIDISCTCIRNHI